MLYLINQFIEQVGQLSHLHNKGLPPTILMKITGHSSLKQLMHYEYSSVEDVTSALEKI